MNGFIGPPRELSATEKSELLDAATPSGSGKEVLELSGPSEPVAHELAETFAPVAYELMNHGTADERSTIQNHGARSKYTIFVSTNMSSQSWTSIGTSTDIPCVGTTICSQKPKTVNLDRSLPPTPISESPQIPRVISDFSEVVTTRKGSEAFVERPAAGKSVCGIMGRVPSHTRLNAWQRELAHSSYASMYMEFVISPGLSEAEIVKPLNVYKEMERSRHNFFQS